MSFTFAPTDYMKHLEEYMELDEVQFSPEQSKEEVIARLKEISRRKREISDVQNQMIAEYIEQYENGQELTEEDADQLMEFLGSMFIREPIQCFDPPVALRLSRILYAHHHKKGNLEKVMDSLFYGSISEMFMKINLETFEFLTFPKLSEEYLSRMEEFSPEIRKKLITAYYYRLITKNDDDMPKIFDLFPEMMANITPYVERDFEPQAGKMLVLKLRHNLLSMFIMMSRNDDENKKCGRETVYNLDIEKYRGLLEEVIESLAKELETTPMDPGSRGQMDCTLTFARFHMGQISFKEMTDILEKYCLTERDDPASQMMMLQANAFYLDYIHACSPYSHEEEERLSRERIQKVLPKILEMKKQKMYMFTPMIVNFLGATSFYAADFNDFYDIALEFTVYADKALYVHTVMVKEICHLLLGRILEENPDLIDGVNGWDTAYIKANKEKVMAMMDMCAMCHDIGKHYIIDVVSNSSRRLTEDEFGMIKHHPQYFEEFYQKPKEEKARITCIRDCALLHHRWHDGKGGYPNLPQTANRPFVDIIAIADSLDAATDYIGRPYGGGRKTLDELIEEFLNMGGTRYGREVAEILSEPDIRAAVAETITKRREEVNYRIYAFHEIEGK